MPRFFFLSRPSYLMKKCVSPAFTKGWRRTPEIEREGESSRSTRPESRRTLHAPRDSTRSDRHTSHTSRQHHHRNQPQQEQEVPHDGHSSTSQGQVEREADGGHYGDYEYNEGAESLLWRTNYEQQARCGSEEASRNRRCSGRKEVEFWKWKKRRDTSTPSPKPLVKTKTAAKSMSGSRRLPHIHTKEPRGPLISIHLVIDGFYRWRHCSLARAPSMRWSFHSFRPGLPLKLFCLDVTVDLGV